MFDPVDPASRNVAEYAVKGNQIVNIGVGGAPQCLGGASFLAKTGEQYEATLIQEDRYDCAITVNKLSLKNGSPLRLPFQDINGLICKSPY